MSKISCDSLFVILPPDLIDLFLQHFPNVEEFEFEDDLEIPRSQWMDVLKWLTRQSPARGKKITLSVSVEDQSVPEDKNVQYVDFGFKTRASAILSTLEKQALVARRRKPWRGHPFWSGPLSDAAWAAQETLKPLIDMDRVYRITHAIGYWLDGDVTSLSQEVLDAIYEGRQLRAKLEAKQLRWAALDRIINLNAIGYSTDHPSLISDEEWFDISPCKGRSNLPDLSPLNA